MFGSGEIRSMAYFPPNLTGSFSVPAMRSQAKLCLLVVFSFLVQGEKRDAAAVFDRLAPEGGDLLYVSGVGVNRSRRFSQQLQLLSKEEFLLNKTKFTWMFFCCCFFFLLHESKLRGIHNKWKKCYKS